MGDGIRHLEHKACDAQLHDVLELGPVDSEPAQANRRPFPGKEAEHPEGAGRLGQDRRQGRAPDTHFQSIDEDGIQNDVQGGAQDHRHHANPGKALGVDEGIHAKADQDGNGARHVNAEIVQGVGQRGRIASQEGQSPGGRGKEQEHQGPADDKQASKRCLHDPSGPLVVPLAPGDGGEGGAAGAAEVGKGADQSDQREANPETDQGVGALRLRQVADVHAVHDVVEDVYQLGQDDGQPQLQDQR